jgi:hypothetical protein
MYMCTHVECSPSRALRITDSETATATKLCRALSRHSPSWQAVSARCRPLETTDSWRFGPICVCSALLLTTTCCTEVHRLMTHALRITETTTATKLCRAVPMFTQCSSSSRRATPQCSSSETPAAKSVRSEPAFWHHRGSHGMWCFVLSEFEQPS